MRFPLASRAALPFGGTLALLLAGALILALSAAFATSALAADIRDAARRASQEREAALQGARESEARILSDRDALTEEVTRLATLETALENDLDALTQRITNLGDQRRELSDEWSRRELEFREISGNVRVVARDLETILRQSLITAARPERVDELEPLLREGYFPDIDDITVMADLFLEEMTRNGEVDLRREATFVGRTGGAHTGTILTLGGFLAIYRDPDETGFLRFSPDERKLFALSELPPRGMRREIERYLDGKTDDVPVDLSGGAALRQLTGRTGLLEQIRAGGPLVWPIGIIALLAFAIVVERMLFLNRVHSNTDRLMGSVNEMAATGDWAACEELVEKHEKRRSPVIQVLMAGLSGRREDRETLENILHEAILREIPRLERFLSLLATFGTVAPLLGLLGTVTGMIATFRVITLHGTGDPKLMSGGISEALVTTELGLAVAIPILLLHVVLSRRVNHIVGEMEEKAVGLTNIIHKERIGDGSSVVRD